jgi:hypothetical protein
MHKFKDEIIYWLNGNECEYRIYIGPCFWYKIKDLGDFLCADEVRKLNKNVRLEENQIKPIDRTPQDFFKKQKTKKQKTKKMVQWLFKSNDGELLIGGKFYEKGKTPVIDFFYIPIKPLPHTEIEIEE